MTRGTRTTKVLILPVSFRPPPIVNRRAHLEQLRISAATPAADKTRALKEIDGIDKTLAELTTYENDILYPLATQQVQIDLDDGVKVNYAKFGKALRRVPGLSE